MVKPGTDLLREFYFSPGQNYTAFKNKKEKAADASPRPEAAEPPPPAAAATPAAEKEEPPPPPPSSPPDGAKQKPQAKTAPKPVGSALQVAKKSSDLKDKPLPAVDAASSEFISFLKQQQDLQKHHNKLEEVMASFEKGRRQEQREIGQVRKQAAELLRDMEVGTGWNLQSKYTVDNIIKDAALALQVSQLIPVDAEPQFFDIQQQAANLQKLKQDHQERVQFEAHKVAVNNGLRRLDRVEKEVKNTQLDASELARVPDSLFIQLEHVFTTPTLQSLIEPHENSMQHLLFKLEEAREDREAALEDGEMQLAEKHYYTIVELYEELQGAVLEKLGIVDKAQKETGVFDKVRNTYQQKASDDVKRIKHEKETLKKKCEQDTQKLFALRERIEAVEKQMVLKMAEDCRKSDELLQKNTEKLEACWAKIEECERELCMLERERHREVKKRVEDKEKDEQRRMEFERFCEVCDKHTAHLDLTVRNCESLIHVANLIGEFVQSGFTSLSKDFEVKTADCASTQLFLHKEHLTMFRGFFLALGELTHKKEKKIEDVDKQIQTSHINQELCADTLNPNAKKFSDVKKELLRVRDELEQDVRELKEKAAEALEKFKVSEDALKDAEVDFVHPVVEHQEKSLETRAKMVEYKAIAIGHVDSAPIRSELEDLKRQLATTKQQVEAVASRSLTSSAALPAIRGN